MPGLQLPDRAKIEPMSLLRWHDRKDRGRRRARGSQSSFRRRRGRSAAQQPGTRKGWPDRRLAAILTRSGPYPGPTPRSSGGMGCRHLDGIGSLSILPALCGNPGDPTHRGQTPQTMPVLSLDPLPQSHCRSGGHSLDRGGVMARPPAFRRVVHSLWARGMGRDHPASRCSRGAGGDRAASRTARGLCSAIQFPR